MRYNPFAFNSVQFIFLVQKVLCHDGKDMVLSEEYCIYVYDDYMRVLDEISRNKKGKIIEHIKNFYDLNDYLTKSIDTMKGDNIFAEIKDKNNNTVRKDTINNNFNKILYKNST